MPAPTNLSALAPLVEMLVESEGAADRDRILLDAPLFLGIAPAAALWRPADAKLGPNSDWHEILARGPREALPDKAQLLAVVRGHLPSELPDGKRVLVAGSGATMCALVLGGVLSAEEGTDLIEALLVASAAIEEAAAEPSERLVDRMAAPLPSTQPNSQGTASPGAELEEYERLCHDVRNHLASIRTTQELLERYEDRLNEDERHHFRDVLEREVRRASGLLVQAVHPEPEQAPGRTEHGCTRPAEVISDIVDAERAACEASGIKLQLTQEAGSTSLTCALDELGLTRLVRNLVVNAREALTTASIQDAEIRVHIAGVVTDSGLWMALAVHDNGPGIQGPDLARVWEAGFTAGKPDGHGVGLSVVRELTEGVGGTVQARNATPGAVFELQLPPSSEA